MSPRKKGLRYFSIDIEPTLASRFERFFGAYGAKTQFITYCISKACELLERSQIRGTLQPFKQGDEKENVKIRRVIGAVFRELNAGRKTEYCSRIAEAKARECLRCRKAPMCEENYWKDEKGKGTE